MARRKDGSFIEIMLPNGKYSYGRILKHSSFAFYDIYSDTQIRDIDEFLKSEVLFTNAVYNYAITKNRWKLIAFRELEPYSLPMNFIQDAIDPHKFELYNPNTGTMMPAAKEQCLGLECAAVWEPEHIEERIIDHFEGRINKWVRSLQIKD